MVNVTTTEFWEYRVARTELRQMYLHHLSEQRNRMVKCVFLWDLGGMTMRYFSLLRSKRVASFFQDFTMKTKDMYPEIAELVVVIRSPWFVQMVWRGIRPLLAKRTLEKIRVLDSTSFMDDEKKGLVTIAPKENWPGEIGGSCPDSPCSWRVELLQKNNVDDSSAEDGTVLQSEQHRLEIGAGKEYKITRSLQPEEVLTWEMFIVDRDIDFSVEKVDGKEEEKEEAKDMGKDVDAVEGKENCSLIVGTTRLFSKTLIREAYTNNSGGEESVRITLSNKYSWFNSKPSTFVYSSFEREKSTKRGVG